MSNLTDALIAAKLVGGSGGSGGGSGLPEILKSVIVANSFEPTSETSADFDLTAVDGWIKGSYSFYFDAETGGLMMTYTFNPDPYEEGNVPPSFWNEGDAGTIAWLEELLNLKLAAHSGHDSLAYKICDVFNPSVLPGAFTL